MEPARAATIDDVDRLVELANELHAELRVMRGGDLWERREARVQPDAGAFAALLARDDASIVVGTIDGVVVGYGTVEIEVLRDSTRLGVIGDLFVEADARDVSVGEEIANALVAFCVQQQVVGVDAFALPGHREAKNFFERSGFTARALVMHKRL
jgi:N-acetylglutamate synthase-like GNAT family acetyltransferase